jgi:2-polyprenyl-3-methyl-5-hydroxy-6-metoxy-1,4-benzoquinol methylase
VVGIDVSVTSPEHTERLKQKYNLRNLETRQVQIEDVNELERQFDHIICTGVLHHLADPDAGLRALRSVLKPDGAMYLMIVEQVKDAAPHARDFFQQLWRYDQVVFDTSPSD